MNIERATREINQILRQLEHSSGSIVESLSLDKIDATTYADTRKNLFVTVVIELKRMPSHNWQGL